jgi:hypothetical protein
VAERLVASQEGLSIQSIQREQQDEYRACSGELEVLRVSLPHWYSVHDKIQRGLTWDRTRAAAA